MDFDILFVEVEIVLEPNGHQKVRNYSLRAEHVHQTIWKLRH